MTRIAVIGLGRMGAAIAQRVAGTEVPVTSWTRSGRSVPGVPLAATLAEAVGAADILILSLYDDAAVADVLDQLLTLDLSGKLIIETSTVVPTVLGDRMGKIEAAGAMAVDAPISGGPELVAAGKCGVFIGGTDAAAEAAKDPISLFSDRVFHVGPLGAGLVMKTINNAMLQCYFNGLYDFMPLAKRAGLPLETAMKILLGGPAGLPMVKDRLPKILGEDTSKGFTIAAAEKDRDVFQRVVEAYDLTSSILEQSGGNWAEAIEAGLAEEDPAALIPFAYNKG